MKKKETVFDYLISIFMIYGFSILCICSFCILFGEEAADYSTLFALGGQGLTVDTLLQFFLLSAIIATLKFVLFTDGLLKKNIPLAVRIIVMFGAVIGVIVVMVILFDWFPVNRWEPWVSFFVCFMVCAIISAILSAIREKHENKKLEEALSELKKGTL